MYIRSIIRIVFKFSIFFAIFVLLGFIFFTLILKNKNKDGKMSSMQWKVFGLLMELDNFSIMAISICVVRFIFLVYIMFNRADLMYLHLFILIMFSFLFGIFSKNIKNLFIDLGSSIALYVALFSSKLLTSYLLEVRFAWYILAANILLIIFISLYIMYFGIRNINNVVSRSKYIRRYRNEENY